MALRMVCVFWGGGCRLRVLRGLGSRSTCPLLCRPPHTNVGTCSPSRRMHAGGRHHMPARAMVPPVMLVWWLQHGVRPVPEPFSRPHSADWRLPGLLAHPGVRRAQRRWRLVALACMCRALAGASGDAFGFPACWHARDCPHRPCRPMPPPFARFAPIPSACEHACLRAPMLLLLVLLPVCSCSPTRPRRCQPRCPSAWGTLQRSRRVALAASGAWHRRPSSCISAARRHSGRAAMTRLAASDDVRMCVGG